MNLTCLLALTGVLSAAAVGGPEETCTVIDRAQRTVKARLTEISGSIVSMERGGLVDHRRMDDLLVLTMNNPAPAEEDESPQMGLIELTDGQRWVGTYVPGVSRSGRIAWDTANLGRLSVMVDRVRSMRLRSGDEAVIVRAQETDAFAGAIGDRMILTNGDVLRGYLESIGEEFAFETNDGHKVSLSFARVAQVDLANMATAREGVLLWLADGSVVRVDDLSWTPGVMQVTIDGKTTGRMSGGMLGGVAFAGELFAALADLEPRVERVGEWMKWVEKPALLDADAPCGLGDVQLHGPLAATYTLPAGARWLRTTAVVPRSAGPWADLVLVIGVDGRVVWREAMDATGRSRRDVNVNLEGAGELTLRIDEGGRGPVQDVVILEKPIILMDGK